MKITLSDINFNVEEYQINSSSKNYLFFLHGFSGSSSDWTEVISLLNKNFNVFTIDLIGQGKSDSPIDVSFYRTESMIDQLFKIIKKITEEKIFLAGYSMGGRAALSFAASHQENLKGLILGSSSAGLVDEQQRSERIQSDEKLAQFIENHSMEEFVDYWMNIDLFKSQKNLPKSILTNVRKSKLKNNKTGLANSLRGFGQGIMPHLHNDVKNISIKTLLISGELDLKYAKINYELSKLFSHAQHITIKNAGHNIHLEQPSSFANVINNFLSEF